MKKVLVIIPTYNEKENIKKLVLKIDNVLKKNKLQGEIIIVDDNRDVLNIDTSRKQIGGDQNTRLAKTKVFENFPSFLTVERAMG